MVISANLNGILSSGDFGPVLYFFTLLCSTKQRQRLLSLQQFLLFPQL